MQETTLKNNLIHLNKELSSQIQIASSPGNILPSKVGSPILQINDIFFHSIHDPNKESRRLIEGLKPGNENKLYIFFGAGLGYSVRIALESENITIVWMECDAGILKSALSLFDYSDQLISGRLRIILSPFTEDNLFTAFKGLGNHVTSYIPHRPSLTWKEDLYTDCKFVCDKFFRKKDVNIATLSKFETIWTRNLLLNIPELLQMKPVSLLFGIASGIPVIVCGAGPSLEKDLPKLYEYRNRYILICVDTALNILVTHNIEPDLIYSVDPQSINKSYLEGYDGKGILVFDPTSCYNSLRLPGNFTKGFFTSSPFPLLKLLTNYSTVDVGDIPFGGSVSTNAVSLADLMEASIVLFVGQDLAFTNGFAHCRGAVLEERLNQKESRKFRREIHNFRQLNALPKLKVKGIHGEFHYTNEKMQIFRKWFSDRAKDKKWLNLTRDGSYIENIKTSTIDDYFNSVEIDLYRVEIARKSIQSIASDPTIYINKLEFIENSKKIISDLGLYENIISKGLKLSNKIYHYIEKGKNNSQEFNSLLKEMEKIDEQVSSKKGISEIIGLGVQRVILMITEGYDMNLSISEKKNSSLGVARKSILLYQGLYDATKLIIKTLKKSIIRVKII